MTLSTGPRKTDPVHVVGLAATPFLPEHDAMLDELVFDVVHRALREAGLRKQDVGLSVLASMDVIDGRSISSGLTTTAMGGYLADAFRIEGDSGVAISAAADAVAAGDAEVTVAVVVHNPETRSQEHEARDQFASQVSNLAFEPHFDRPVGMTANIAFALQAGRQIDAGQLSLTDMASLAATEINRGADRDRSVRRQHVDPAAVLDSNRVAWPLNELMLPAASTGAIAVVLASPARAGRCLGRNARITGIGHATGAYTWSGQWLDDPAATTSRAARSAFTQAGFGDDVPDLTVIESTAITPALHRPIVAALGADNRSGTAVNPSGGVRSNFPGLANGALRLLEVVEHLETQGAGARGLAHSVDTITGPVSDDATVFVVEAA
ncbi:hypothetical protein A5719_21765 [Mycolicibacterium peregrinum]|uniref:hypothetical protein n=1 Tax=Mycolicibacterium peregrinum TaxID=43304 RepID=UPI0007EBF2F4|nr:hypothetical protein [Mycolicibacterium peregrinum]OBF37444.1 hypothetical protein A5719_21765 [Mycolicibacterium peregrinum]